MVNVWLHSTSDASPSHPNAAAALGAPALAALLLLQILPVFSVVAPCRRGASLVSVRCQTFTTGCSASRGLLRPPPWPSHDARQRRTGWSARSPEYEGACRGRTPRSATRLHRLADVAAPWDERHPAALSPIPRRTILDHPQHTGHDRRSRRDIQLPLSNIHPGVSAPPCHGHRRLGVDLVDGDGSLSCL